MENWSPQTAIFIQLLTGTFGLVESPFSTMLQNAKRTVFDAVFFMVNSWENGSSWEKNSNFTRWILSIHSELSEDPQFFSFSWREARAIFQRSGGACHGAGAN